MYYSPILPWKKQNKTKKPQQLDFEPNSQEICTDLLCLGGHRPEVVSKWQMYIHYYVAMQLLSFS